MPLNTRTSGLPVVVPEIMPVSSSTGSSIGAATGKRMPTANKVVARSVARFMLLWPLNQFNVVTDRIDREAQDNAGGSERSRIARHGSTGGLKGRDGRLHVLHRKNHVHRQVLHVVGIAMKKYHLRILVRLGSFHRRAEVHEDFSAS